LTDGLFPYQRKREYYRRQRWAEMTLVIALCGNDGCLLASDTKISVTLPAPSTIDFELLAPVRHTANRSKISLSDKHGILIAWAGQDVAAEAAAKLKERCDLAKSLSDDELQQHIKAACEDACTLPLFITRPQFDGQIIAVNPRSAFNPLWSATFQRGLDVPGQPRGTFYWKPRGGFDKQIIGQDANSAIFFLERYYRPKTFSVDELLFLSGHVIRNASYLANDLIDGLEIATCTKKGTPRFIKAETLKEIWDKSKLLSADIERQLRKPLRAIRRDKNLAML
jgi:20S proteasome alpha/beta subunit